MTMHPSTGSDGSVGPGGESTLPSWLPDEPTVNRMAAEFFTGISSDFPEVPSAPTEFDPEDIPRDLGDTDPWGALTAFRTPVSSASQPSAAEPTTTPRFYFLDEAEAPPPDRGAALPSRDFDVHAIRADFPILRERINGYPLAWFDNAATTQKPLAVIDRISAFYQHENSNIHRGAHELAARATDAYENARAAVARFIGAPTPEQIVFVRGATEGINFVAQTWGRKHIGAGDEIVISHLEHHANIVPWQMLAAETGAVIRTIPVDDSGQLRMDQFGALLSDRTKLVAVTHVSNALGTITPVAAVVEQAKRAGAVVLIDGAQSAPHIPIDVAALDAHFFTFSGHKLFGPTGIGAIYGAAEVLRDLPPWHGGGNMISDVTLERATYQPPPARFEAGTGNIADAVGLAAAIEYIETLGVENIAAYEHFLLDYATARMGEIPGLRLIGTAGHKTSVLSFVLDGHQPEAVGRALNEKGIAVRAGHHCAQPILRRFGVEATVRPSFAFYNTCAEIDRMVEVVRQLAMNSGRRH
ncbi:MAG: cysteine desulfurase [Mycobacteriaceae bacterium]|nr:cysteine desulfurase [Mycobacteriaceae bacterium]